MQVSNLPAYKFPLAWGADAGGSYINTIPVASQILVTPGRASLTDGFPPLNWIDEAAGGVPPFGGDMNGILNQITSWLQWSNAGGPIFYDATFSAAIGGYPKGALLYAAAGSSWWLSTVDNNVTDPDTGGAGWQIIQFGGTYAGNPNGHVAGVAAANGFAFNSMVWDTIDQFMWVCTTTGNAAGAVWSVVSTSRVVPTIASANAAFPILFSGYSDAVNYGSCSFNPGLGILSAPIFNAGGSVPTATAGNAYFGVNSVYGAQIIGYGSGYDVTVYNNAGAFVAGVPHGSTEWAVGGNLSVSGAYLFFNSANTGGNTAYPILFSTGSGDAIRSNSGITINPYTNTLNTNITGVATYCSSALGYNSPTYHNVTSSRSYGTGADYTNSNSYPIMVFITVEGNGTSTYDKPYVGGVQVGYTRPNGGYTCYSFIVPAGATYGVVNGGAGVLEMWTELY
jgi:hypothetical protein